MTEQEAKTVSVGDLLHYSDNERDHLCLFLGRPTEEHVWDPIPGRSMLFKLLITSKNRYCVLDIPYLWLDKL